MDVVLLLARNMLWDCKKGSLITRCHNELRGTLGDLSCIVYKDIIQEPVIQGACRPSLITDLGVEFW